mgnify:CR=1 FL=1
MFKYLMKSLPAQYIFAGYNVRKSLSVVTSTVNGQLVYDIFEYTYVDSHISFYLLMESGKYKNADKNKRIQAYLHDTEDPYCYKDGEITVKISFVDNGPTITDKILAFINEQL